MNDVTVSSPASQEQMESETGSVLVDWHHEESMTTKSFPVTPNTRERCSILPRKAVSLFDGDSDSSEEYTQQRRQKNTTRRSKMRKSGSLFHPVTVRDGKLKIFTTTPTVENNLPPPLRSTILSCQTHPFQQINYQKHTVKGSSNDYEDEEQNVMEGEDHMMILSDNSDDDEERAHLQQSRLTSMSQKLIEIDGSIAGVHSSTPSNQERGRVSALFAEEKPWRTLGLMDDDHAAIKSSSTFQINRTNLETSTISVGSADDKGLLEANINRSRDMIPLSSQGDDDVESTDSEGSEDGLYGDAPSIRSDLSGISDLQLDEDVEFDELTMVPNSFIGSGQLHPSMALYVDAEELGNVTHRDANRFVLEHSIMLRAILQLLQEHELHHSHDDTVLKKGPLKKLGHLVGRPIWKVKYVEVRPGSLSYFEDTNMKDRKTIVLDKESSVAINDNINFCLELHTSNKKKYLWIANSEDERQAWMRVLEVSMTGQQQREVDLAPFQLSMERFSRMQNNLRLCRSKHEYLHLMGEMWETDVMLPTAYQSIRPKTDTKGKSVADFWKFLGKTTVVINGHAIPANSPHNAERVVGALSRCVLEYSRSGDHTKENLLTEIQSLSYSRDVLMGIWKSRSHDDAHNLIDTMTQNINLAICLPYQEDSNIYLHITYTTADDIADSSLNESQEDLSGWVRTRSQAFKNWKNRYFVISESVLSYYAHSSPRPHGLRGQIVLAGATLMAVDDRLESNLFILSIHAQDDQERQLSFRNEEDFLEWKDALQKGIDLCTPLGAILSKTTRRRPGRALIKGATRDTSRMIKGAADGGFNLLRGLGVVKKNVSFDSFQSDSSVFIRSKGNDHGKQHEPTVRLTAEACSYYKIITADPSGNDKNDTWVTVRANISQIFLLSGGATGRISKGEEVVALTFREGLVDPVDFGDNNRTYDVSSNYSKTSLY